jgi:hypothetical protein
VGGMCDRFCDCAILAMSDHTFRFPEETEDEEEEPY